MSKLPEPGDPRAFYVLDLHAFVWRNVTGARQRAPDTFARWLGRLMATQKVAADQIVAADDSKGESFRHAILREAGKVDGEGYKGDRKRVDPLLFAIYERARAQIAETLGDVGVAVYRAPGFEADDVIATIADRQAGVGQVKCAACGWESQLDDYFDAVDFTNGAPCPRCNRTPHHRGFAPRSVVIVGGDRDLLALVGPRAGGGAVTVYDGYRRVYANDEDVRRKMEVAAAQIADFWALVGGKNNVPGVRGIGPEGAKKLLACGALDDLLRRVEGARAATELDALGAPPKLLACLIAGADDARLSRRLTELRTNAPIVRDPG